MEIFACDLAELFYCLTLQSTKFSCFFQSTSNLTNVEISKIYDLLAWWGVSVRLAFSFHDMDHTEAQEKRENEKLTFFLYVACL